MIKIFEKRQDNRITELCVFAIMIALDVVLSRFLSFKTFDTKLSLSFLTTVFIAVSYGPYKSALFAIICDLIGALLFPFGPFFFGFTATAMLRGFIWGMFLYERKSFRTVVSAVFTEQLVCSLFMNSLWISYLYKLPIVPLLIKRLSLQIPLYLVVEIVLITFFLNIPILIRSRIKK